MRTTALIVILLALLLLIGTGYIGAAADSPIIPYNDIPAGHEEFTATGIRLDGGQGTWFYNPTSAPSWASDEGFVPVAINEWNGLTPNLTLAYGGTTTVATSLCNGQGPDGQNTITWGPDMGSTIAMACWQGNGECDIILGQNDSQAGIDMATVLAHELGHCLGLGHSDDYAAIMNPYYHGITGPVADDIAGLCSIYGCPPPVTPTPTPTHAATATPTTTAPPTTPSTPTPTPHIYRAYIPGLAVN